MRNCRGRCRLERSTSAPLASHWLNYICVVFFLNHLDRTKLNTNLELPFRNPMYCSTRTKSIIWCQCLNLPNYYLFNCGLICYYIVQGVATYKSKINKSLHDRSRYFCPKVRLLRYTFKKIPHLHLIIFSATKTCRFNSVWFIISI